MSSPCAGGRPEAVDAPRGEQPVVDDALQQRLRVVVEIPRRGAVLGVVEDGRHAALQLPRVEEERPVDERHQIGQRHLHLAPSEERRHRHVGLRPVDLQAIRPRGGQRQQGLGLTAAVLRAQRLPGPRASPRRSRPRSVGAQQLRHDFHGAAGIEHVRHRPAVFRRDLDRGVLLARRRAADEQRRLQAAPLHLARHRHHLVERRRDQAAEADRGRPACSAAVRRITSWCTITPRSITL